MNKFSRYFDEQKAETMSRIECDTKRYRMGFADITVVDAEDKPISDARIHAKQLSHEFKFGCNLFLLDQFPDEEHNSQYRKAFPKLFNYGIAPFYWSDFELEDGTPRIGREDIKVYRRPAPEAIIRYCRENDIKIKGHPLFWHLFIPAWFETDKDSSMPRISRRIRELAQAYGGDIFDWDVVNESLTPSQLKTAFNKLPHDYVRKCFDCADRNFPDARLFINETTGVWDTYFNFEYGAYYMQIENLLMKGARIDGIGLQYHMFYNEQTLLDRMSAFYNPQRLFDTMDALSDFRRPLSISEITVPAYNGTEENMESQAEITEWLYRIWFSHPMAESIVWWNLVDGTAAYAPLGSNSGENYYHGGLLNFDMSPKPVYNALDRLINREWHTEGVLPYTDGKAKLHGFYGDYEITVEREGGCTTHRISLTKSGKKSFKLQV